MVAVDMDARPTVVVHTRVHLAAMVADDRLIPVVSAEQGPAAASVVAGPTAVEAMLHPEALVAATLAEAEAGTLAAEVVVGTSAVVVDTPVVEATADAANQPCSNAAFKPESYPA